MWFCNKVVTGCDSVAFTSEVLLGCDGQEPWQKRQREEAKTETVCLYWQEIQCMLSMRSINHHRWGKMLLLRRRNEYS